LLAPLDLQELAFIEFFAGNGNVWKAVRADSYATVGIDITYVENVEGGDNPFDILSNSGFGCHPQLVCNVYTVLLQQQRCAFMS